MLFLHILAVLSIFNTHSIALDTLSFRQSSIALSSYSATAEVNKSYNYDFDYYQKVSKPQIDEMVKEQADKEQEIQEKARLENLEKQRQDQIIQEKLAQEEAQRKLAIINSQKLQAQKAQVQSIKPTVSTSEVPQPADAEGSIRTICSLVGCDPVQVIRVMYCESGGQNKMGYAGNIGPMQFNSNTFYGNAKKYGIANPDVWNPQQQFEVAGRMFAAGQAWQWACK